MKLNRIASHLALSVLTAQATGLSAQTNRIRLVPEDRLAAAHSHVKQPEIFKMATNTPAFEQYAVNLMLKQANQIRESWHLDVSESLSVDNILFWVQATPYGINGGIGTSDSRYNWGFNWGVLDHFDEKQYRPFSFRYKDDASAKLAKIQSKISAKEAEDIARTALHELGLTEKQLHLIEPPEVNQYTFEESNGVVYPLPMFNVGWHVEGFTGMSEPDSPSVTFDISGITKNVAEYFNPHTPRVPLPTNYFQMLGLPTNYLETLPPRERKGLGLPALTNAPGSDHKIHRVKPCMVSSLTECAHGAVPAVTNVAGVTVTFSELPK